MPQGRGRAASRRSRDARARDAGRGRRAKRLSRGLVDRGDRLRGAILPARAIATARPSERALPSPCREHRAWFRALTRRPGAGGSLGGGVRATYQSGEGRQLRGTLRTERDRIRRALPANRRGLSPGCQRGPGPVLCRYTGRERARPSVRARALPTDPPQASVLWLHHGRFPTVFLRFWRRVQPEPHRR